MKTLTFKNETCELSNVKFSNPVVNAIGHIFSFHTQTSKSGATPEKVLNSIKDRIKMLEEQQIEFSWLGECHTDEIETLKEATTRLDELLPLFEIDASCTEKLLPVSKLTKSQVITKTFENFRVERGAGKLVVKIRYDDSCGNGHNSFSITGDLYRDGRSLSCGSIHSDIKEFAPEIAHLIKWHGMTSESPLHYIHNTTYQASERDCNGLLKGEKRQILRGGDKNKPCWELAYVNGDVESKIKIEGLESNVACLAHELPETELEYIQYVPWCRVGEGKEANLESARNTAIWSDATLEQLQDKEALKARLPELVNEFKNVIESLGMEF